MAPIRSTAERPQRLVFGLAFGIACCAMSASGRADYRVSDHGAWPDSWPQELNLLRKQARTLQGSQLNLIFYEIPIDSRAEFESVWPHLLKVKTKGAPIVLRSSPDSRFGDTFAAGVRIQSPPPEIGVREPSARPRPGRGNDRSRWVWTIYIELIVDGNVVDLNRIPLPADTPIIDERFGD